MWHLNSKNIPMVIWLVGFIKKGTDKYLNKILVREQEKKKNNIDESKQ